ncbi:SDR family oxidoreductase [Dactylosporangium siamense]|uniref:Short-chain dehydrogenase/reductase n=1 Tax=Dactylosporangium siamense TaxID=685454 RepID=A0A919Q0J9_9ACTN|nr:short-chain dehydrogenase/reductase [Dactylosporangium siamense]
MVTGAAGGIGSAVARRLRADGWDVAGLDRVVTPFRQLPAVTPFRQLPAVTPFRQLPEPTGQAGVEPVDLLDELAVAAAFAALGPVTALVTCAGLTAGAPAHETTLEDWHTVLDANLTSAFLAVKHALPGMIAAGRGVIVTIGSIHSGSFGPGLPAYAAAKAGLAAFTRQVAVDYGRHGIRAVTIAPGWIRTPATEERLDGDTDRERQRDAHPLRRLGEPADVAAAVAFAVSDGAAMLTGTEIVLDGGATAVQAAALLRAGPRARLGLKPLEEPQ